MTTLTDSSTAAREPALLGQTVLIGGSSGVGLKTARCARRDGAEVVLDVMDVADAGRYVADDVRLALAAARHAAGTMRPGGTLLLMSGTGARRPAVGISVTALLSAGLPALTGVTLDVDGGQQVVLGSRA